MNQWFLFTNQTPNILLYVCLCMHLHMFLPGCADDFLHNLVPENRDIDSRYKNYTASMYTYFLERVSFETLFQIM